MTTADQLRECADRLWARPEYPTLLRKAADELDRLQSRFDSKKFTHRQDCCGAQIETRCLGCAMADLNCSMAEDDTMRAEIERLNAERETIISDFLKRTGQYVTNDASRDAAIAAAVAAEHKFNAPPFEGTLEHECGIYPVGVEMPAPPTWMVGVKA